MNTKTRHRVDSFNPNADKQYTTESTGGTLKLAVNHTFNVRQNLRRLAVYVKPLEGQTTINCCLSWLDQSEPFDRLEQYVTFRNSWAATPVKPLTKDVNVSKYIELSDDIWVEPGESVEFELRIESSGVDVSCYGNELRVAYIAIFEESDSHELVSKLDTLLEAQELADGKLDTLLEAQKLAAGKLNTLLLSCDVIRSRADTNHQAIRAGIEKHHTLFGEWKGTVAAFSCIGSALVAAAVWFL